MNRTSSLALVAITAALLTLQPSGAAAHSLEVRSYEILPGSNYMYKPSPEGPGIPGGQPNQYELDFGVSGLFDVEFDDTADTARLLNVELTLTGNEAVQMNPPAFAPVTADRVEEFLEMRLFHNLFVAAPWDQYQDETFPDFYFFDFLQGLVRLEGGFDATPADGTAMLFDVDARLIPEPAARLLMAVAAAALVAAQRLPLRVSRAPTASGSAPRP